MKETYEIENGATGEIIYKIETRELVFEALASWYHRKYLLKEEKIICRRRQMYTHQIITFYADGYIYRFTVNALF